MNWINLWFGRLYFAVTLLTVVVFSLPGAANCLEPWRSGRPFWIWRKQLMNSVSAALYWNSWPTKLWWRATGRELLRLEKKATNISQHSPITLIKTCSYTYNWSEIYYVVSTLTNLSGFVARWLDTPLRWKRIHLSFATLWRLLCSSIKRRLR